MAVMAEIDSNIIVGQSDVSVAQGPRPSRWVLRVKRYVENVTASWEAVTIAITVAASRETNRKIRIVVLSFCIIET